MKKIKLKINDNVRIMSGKDKNREGKIEKIFPKLKKVSISGVNQYKRHIKGSQGQKGGIYDLVRPMDISKVMLICPNCKKSTRIGITIVKSEKLRICKKCKKQIK